MTKQQLLIFSDLDGTLLDHETYDWQAAAPALSRLTQADIPVIFNSSKTQAEIYNLRQTLKNRHPFIVENGGAVCVPEDYFSASATLLPNSDTIKTTCFGRHYTELISILKQLRAEHGWKFRGFQDLSDESVSALTGLSVAHAAQARQRVCSEPLVWEDSDSALEEFTQQLTAFKLRIVRGGRFFHIMDQFDKAEGISWLKQHYQLRWPDRHFITVGLGDGPNDQRMLESVDIAVAIKAPHQTPVKLNTHKDVIYTTDYGAKGWQTAMTQILARYNIPKLDCEHKA